MIIQIGSTVHKLSDQEVDMVMPKRRMKRQLKKKVYPRRVSLAQLVRRDSATPGGGDTAEMNAQARLRVLEKDTEGVQKCVQVIPF